MKPLTTDMLDRLVEKMAQQAHPLRPDACAFVRHVLERQHGLPDPAGLDWLTQPDGSRRLYYQGEVLCDGDTALPLTLEELGL